MSKEGLKELKLATVRPERLTANGGGEASEIVKEMTGWEKESRGRGSIFLRCLLYFANERTNIFAVSAFASEDKTSEFLLLISQFALFCSRRPDSTSTSTSTLESAVCKFTVLLFYDERNNLLWKMIIREICIVFE